MTRRYSRQEVVAMLAKTVAEGRPILLGSAGDGFTAKLEEMGGVDLIGVYNSSRFRHYGVGSLGSMLPMGRNNDIVVEYAPEIINQVKSAPIIVGFCGQDPRTLWEPWLNALGGMGVSVFQNFPTVGLIDADSRFRRNLEESGLGFDKEVAVLKLAHDLGYATFGYCFTPDEARAVAAAGVDILAVHTGLTAGGLVGPEDVMNLDEAVRVTTELIEAAKEARPALDFFPVTHGGPMKDPATVAYVLERTEAVGYVGATTFERTPVEAVIPATCREYKDIRLTPPDWLLEPRTLMPA